MHEHHQHETGPASVEPEPERRPPSIYVASLSDYNNGRLHGVWIDATIPLGDMWAATHDMLAQSSVPGAEEIAVHDHTDFGPWQPGEYTALETVHRVAAGIVEHGPAFAAWADYIGASDDDLEERFEDAYRGEWSSVHEYAQELVNDLGVRIQVDPPAWAHYVSFDTAALARDLEYDLHVADSADGGVYIFDPGS